MSASSPAATARARASQRGQPWALVATALGAGVLVVATAGLDLPVRLVLVTAIGLGLPAALLMLIRPHLAVAVYLAVLPLLLPWPIAAGLNAGEVLTLGILVFGTLSLWEGHARVEPALRALAPIVWPLALLAAISVVSLAVNGITGFQDIAAALFKMLAFALVAVLVHMHAATPTRAKQILTAVLVGALGVAIYAVIEYAAGWGYSEEYGWNRAAGTFEHWNALGGFMALTSPPTLAFAIGSRTLAGRLGWGIAFVLEITALLLSQTLGSVLALVVGAGLALVFVLRLEWRKLFAIGFVVLIGLAAAIVANDALREKVLNVDERVLDRLRTYAVGAAMFRDRFWFGFGSEQAVVDALWFGEADYGITVFGLSSSVAHNSFIAMGVEKGVFGAILFALLIAGALRLLLRHRAVIGRGRAGVWYAGVAVGVLAFLVQNMTNTLALHARMGIVFFALLAVVDRICEQARHRAGQNEGGRAIEGG